MEVISAASLCLCQEKTMRLLHRLQQRLSLTKHEAMALTCLSGLFIIGIIVRQVQQQAILVPPDAYDELDRIFFERSGKERRGVGYDLAGASCCRQRSRLRQARNLRRHDTRRGDTRDSRAAREGICCRRTAHRYKPGRRSRTRKTAPHRTEDRRTHSCVSRRLRGVSHDKRSATGEGYRAENS